MQGKHLWQAHLWSLFSSSNLHSLFTKWYTQFENHTVYSTEEFIHEQRLSKPERALMTKFPDILIMHVSLQKGF